MRYLFNKEGWLKDKSIFVDELIIEVELMDKYQYYFDLYMDCPVDLYMGKLIYVETHKFSDERQLKEYLNGTTEKLEKLALYCIVRYKGDDDLILRSVVLPTYPIVGIDILRKI